MIITNFYVGSEPVSRVYIGTKLVWESVANVRFIGISSSFTHTEGFGALFEEVLKRASVVSTSDARAKLIILPGGVIRLAGDVGSTTYTKSKMGLFARILQAGKSENSVLAYSNLALFIMLDAVGSAETTSTGAAVPNFLTLMDILGEGESKIYGESTPNILPAERLYAECELDSHGRANAAMLFLLDIRGSHESSTHAISMVIPHIITPGKGTGLTSTDNSAVLEDLELMAARGREKFSSYTKGVAEAYWRVFSNAIAESTTDGKARSAALVLLDVRSGCSGEVNALATGLAADVVFSSGESSDYTLAEAIGRHLDVISMSGSSLSGSNSSLVGKVYRAIGRRGKSTNLSHARASAKLRTTYQMVAVAVSYTDDAVTMNPWYLPYNNNGILELRQAYEADFTDGILEVR